MLSGRLKNIYKSSIFSLIKIIYSPVSAIEKFEEIPRSIVLLAQERYGDIILLTPLIRDLKKFYPDLKITVIGVTRLINILKYDPNISDLINIKTCGRVQRKKLLLRDFDLLFNTKDHPSTTMLYLTARIKAKFKVGIYHQSHVGFYNYLLHFDEQVHRAKKNYGLMEFLRIAHWNQTIKPTLYLGDLSAAIKKFVQEFKNQRVIGINMSTSRSYRNWSLENWKMLISKLPEKIVILATAENYKNKEILEKECWNVLKSPKTRNIFEASHLIKHFHLLISPDTALIHVAACFNIPVVGLYLQKVESIRFAPLSDKKIIILAPEMYMDSISVDQVYKAKVNLNLNS